MIRLATSPHLSDVGIFSSPVVAVGLKALMAGEISFYQSA